MYHPSLPGYSVYSRFHIHSDGPSWMADMIADRKAPLMHFLTHEWGGNYLPHVSTMAGLSRALRLSAHEGIRGYVSCRSRYLADLYAHASFNLRIAACLRQPLTLVPNLRYRKTFRHPYSKITAYYLRAI